MTFLRKIAFVTFSVAAFVYLVLQTTQGQRWLNETRTSLFSAELPPELLTFDVSTDQMLSDKFQQLLSNSSQTTALQDLQNQLQQMQSNIADLRVEISRVKDGDELAAVAVSSAVTASPVAMNLQTTARVLEQVKEQGRQIAQTPARISEQVKVQEQGLQIVHTPTFIEKHTDSRQRQLEQQAKLQEVVQRMELTALKAISR